MKNVTIGVLVLALIILGYFSFVKETQSPILEVGTDYGNENLVFSDSSDNDEKKDVVTTVSESIVGKYQDTKDTKFTREFKRDGTVVDMYEGKTVSVGVWEVFTSESGLSGGTPRVPLLPNENYIQLRMSGIQNENFNFKISNLTRKGLELVYMDREGSFTFDKVN